MVKLSNVVLNAYVQKHKLISLVHFITNRCNARCKHCFVDFDSPDSFKGEMSLEEIVEYTKHLGNSLLNVNITGGEPFLRSDIFEIIEAYFNNAGVSSVYITTNGSFPKRIKMFLDKFMVSGIEGKVILSFSIDNFEEAHNENRNLKNLYRNTLESFHLARSYQSDKIVQNIALTVTDHNHEKVMDIYHHLQNEENVDAFTAIVMREEGVVSSIDPAIKKRINKAYIDLTEQIMEDLSNKKSVGYKKSLIGRILNVKNTILYNMLQNNYTEEKYFSQCPSGSVFIVLYANGEVFPCEVLDSRGLGNIRDYNFDIYKLLDNASSQAARTFIKESKCHCIYECALGINIITNKKYIPKLAAGLVKSYL